MEMKYQLLSDKFQYMLLYSDVELDLYGGGGGGEVSNKIDPKSQTVDETVL